MFKFVNYLAKNTCLHYLASMTGSERPLWTTQGKLDERCPGLALLLKYKVRLDLLNLEGNIPLALAVFASHHQSRKRVKMLVGKTFTFNIQPYTITI